jgi:hypothetical protein
VFTHEDGLVRAAVVDRRSTEDDVAVATLKQLVVDCRHAGAQARFWVAALDNFEIRGYDEVEIARLASLGRTPETDPCVIVDGPAFELCFQEVDVADVVKSPLHLDLATSKRTAEAERLVHLGATIVETFESHTWMRDPEGNDFCITDA